MGEPDLSTLLAATILVVKAAGALLDAEWSRVGGPRGTGGSALIDVEIEELLREKLLALFPTDFWGEETDRVLTGKRFCWVVDPNDGTSDFLNGLKGSAISVGLLRDHVPVLGVVFAPVTETLGPDCISWSEGMSSVQRNGIPVNRWLDGRRLTPDGRVMVSAAATGRPRVNAELCAPAQFIPMPSIAYRLARVAAGDGVCAVSLFPVSAHDVVAGHALLRGARGILVDQSGLEIGYETREKMTVVACRCFGGSASATDALHRRDWRQLTGPHAN
ncbi:TPA: inositol monophosphatase [Pseudomonas aeruginosa]|jgi:myo-inositol-1(or 4)-monophosphatase|nr:inositol monophosphatase family protein [Pseudomonas sp. NFPP33]ELZ4498224.1 inositol monophosphatase [Pseudomonas aeruginosa]SDA76908.1 myo-inositol-1(or 4)-monophosphatase [Pseudomonas sp. NFPP33]